MKKVILYQACSLDGYIASSDGSVDWIDTDVDLGKDYALEQFLEKVDTIVMGRKSYEQQLTFGPWSFPNHQTFVLSRQQLTPSSPNTTVGQNLNWSGEKDIWLFGGGGVNRYFLEKGWIDEMLIFVQPVILGSGIGLFGNEPLVPKKITLIQTKELGSGFTLLHYKK